MANSVTDATFKKEVLEHSKPVLVDFWAPWCGPCRMLGPVIEELATELNDSIKIVKVNVDENPTVSTEHNIRGLPTLAIFKNGKVVDLKMGVLPKQKIVEWIHATIK